MAESSKPVRTMLDPIWRVYCAGHRVHGNGNDDYYSYQYSIYLILLLFLFFACNAVQFLPLIQVVSVQVQRKSWYADGEQCSNYCCFHGKRIIFQQIW